MFKDEIRALCKELEAEADNLERNSIPDHAAQQASYGAASAVRAVAQAIEIVLLKDDN